MKISRVLTVSSFFGAVFSSALLMFVLEPFVAKMLLPLLGGSPNVWNTCVVFFQVTLMCGYIYSHLLTRRASSSSRRHLKPGTQVIVHLLVVWLPLFLLPLRAPQTPPTEGHPYLWLFFTLVSMVGGVFFAISTTAPLLQKWFATGGGQGSEDPYFLYAGSNLGAIAGLVVYPFVLEPRFSLTEQSHLASVLYAIFACLVTLCGILLRFEQTGASTAEADNANMPATQTKESQSTISESQDLGRTQIFRIIGLTFIPASLMLGLTTYVTSELSAIPLFWVAPLLIYLLSFVIAFARPPKKLIEIFRILAPLAILTALFPLVWQASAPTDINHAQLVTAGISLHIIALLLVCCACHGSVAELRPNPESLTKYYLVLSLGGVLGSTFNALVAPVVFETWIEYPLVMIAAVAVLIPPRLATLWLVIALVGFWLSLWQDKSVVYRARNFFGCISVRVDRLENVTQFWHGITEHGAESLDPRTRIKPISYFHPQGIIGGLMMQTFALKEDTANGGVISPIAQTDRAPFAVLGLGCGALAAYASKNQTMFYYEINPDVIDVAKNPFFFSYLFDAKQREADIRIVAGDGRLAIQNAPYDYFKLIVMDAFSSDSIPTHLVTKEAVQMYLSKIKKDGMLVFHITNNYYDLKPVLWKLAQELDLHAVTKNDYAAAQLKDRYSTEWVVLSRDEAVLQKLSDIGWEKLAPSKELRLWTDDYCSPQSILIVPMS